MTKYKEFTDLPVVRPATAPKQGYSDSHMQATHRSAAESERLDKILAHYEKNIDEEIKEQQRGNLVTEEVIEI